MSTAEIEPMGRVLTEATIESLEDLWAAKRGLLGACLNIAPNRARNAGSVRLDHAFSL